MSGSSVSKPTSFCGRRQKRGQKLKTWRLTLVLSPFMSSGHGKQMLLLGCSRVASTQSTLQMIQVNVKDKFGAPDTRRFFFGSQMCIGKVKRNMCPAVSSSKEAEAVTAIKAQSYGQACLRQFGIKKMCSAPDSSTRTRPLTQSAVLSRFSSNCQMVRRRTSWKQSKKISKRLNPFINQIKSTS